MAEQTGRGRQAVKRHKPSRLRNEVRPDSTDDEREIQRHTIQQPDGDAIVPETQFDDIPRVDEHIESDVEDDSAEGPYSATDRAVISRLGIAKKAMVVEQDQTFELFSKKPPPHCDSTTSSLPEFSFAPPRQVLNKTLPKGDVAGLQFVSHATVASLSDEENSKESSNNVADIVALKTTSLADIPDNLQDAQQHINLHEQGESIPPYHLPTISQHREEPHRSGSSPNETASGLPPSAQPAPKPVSGIKKVRTTKKTRKGKKGALSQQHGDIWPPRMPSTTGHVHDFKDVVQTVPEVFTDPRDLSLAVAPDGYPTICVEEDTVPHLAIQVLDERDPSSEATREHGRPRQDAQTYHTMLEMPSTMSQGIPDVFAKRVLPSSPQAPTVVTMRHHVADLGQQSLPVDENEAAISRCDGTLFDSQTLTPPMQRQDGILPRDEVVDTEHASQTRSPQPYADANVERTMAQSIGAEASLHGTLNRGGSDRVAKPRRKPRVNNRPISRSVHGQSTPSNVEHSMENLKLAILADTFRVQHDHSAELKHQIEISTALREHVDLQKDSIAKYKQEHQSLEGALGRVTEKAKTNQKFVMGLQKDYEKLQKSTTAAQELSKKILHAKIAELEKEKDDLRCEFGTTTDKLVQSQKKMKAVVEDLYAQFVVNELEKKRLAERLAEQEAACIREQKKSEDLETKLLSGIQNLQSQLKSSGAILIDKLELIQTSVENVAADDGHGIKIKECIEILHSLQAAPLLKLQDVRKAESMLRFFRERMESGMETLSKAIPTDGPTNADLESSMQAQLNDLGNKLLKCEEIAAENRRMHENNAILTEQLEGHQQKASHLNSQIENLKQVESGLTTRCSQLERDLSDLRDDSQGPSSETPDSERIMLELRQQLATSNDDLEAVNAKSRSVEQSYRSLENEKTQLNALLEQAEARILTAGYEQERKAEETRAEPSKKHAAKLSDKEHEFQSRINRLELERDEKEKKCRDLDDNLNLASDEINELKRAAKNLQDSADQLQAELSSQHSTTGTISQQAEEKVNQMQKDNESTLLSMRNEIATAKRENQALSSTLEQARANEDRMKAAETTLVADQHRLREEVTTLRSTVNARDLEIMQIREAAAKEKRKLAEEYAAKMDDLSRCLAKTNMTLKEVEAQARISEDQYHAKLAADQKVAESKLVEAEKEYHDALRKAQEQHILSLKYSSQGSSAELALPEYEQNNRYPRARKKVGRPNQSTIEATLEQIQGLQSPSYIRNDLSQTQIDDWDLFANYQQGQVGIKSLQDDGHDYSIADPISDSVSDTQDVGGLSMSQDFFTERQAQATPQQDGRRATSPTELSEMASDELTRLQKEVQPVSASRLRGYNHDLSKPEGSRSASMVAPVRSDGISADGSHSSHSQERPRSQANTASRMMPPPSGIPHQSQIRDGDQTVGKKLTGHHGHHAGISQKLRNSGTSTPDFIHSDAFMSKQTYNHHESKNSADFESRDNCHSDKRKTPNSQPERKLASKRQRKLSPTRSAVSSSIQGHSPYTYRSSVIGTRSTDSRSSHPKGVASTSSRVKSQARSSGIQSRTSNSFLSSSETHSARQQRMPQARETPPQRRSSSRITRSKSRNSAALGDEFGERFNEELGERY